MLPLVRGPGAPSKADPDDAMQVIREETCMIGWLCCEMPGLESLDWVVCMNTPGTHWVSRQWTFLLMRLELKANGW
jgi:hypothetical protein